MTVGAQMLSHDHRPLPGYRAERAPTLHQRRASIERLLEVAQ